MHTPTPTRQTSTQPLTRQTVYYLEWLDFGPNGNSPKWDVAAFPNYEDETTDHAYALKCFQDIAARDPDRIRLVQADQRIQIIAGPGLETDHPTVFCQPEASEPEVMPVWLTARQLTLLNYVILVQRRQLAESNDPEPIAKAIQTDGQPITGRAGFLTMQLQQLGAAVELTHYRLVFIANKTTTPEQQQQLVMAWRQHLPTAVIYQMALSSEDQCFVWHLYVPAQQEKPPDDQVVRAITVAQVIANVDFDHQDHVYGNAYWEFVKEHPGSLVTPTPSPTQP